MGIIIGNEGLFKFFDNMDTIRQTTNKGLFGKEINCHYNLISKQPWIFFQNPYDEKLSFKIHDLEFKKEQYAFEWHASAQREGSAIFEGFVNRFYNHGIGNLRGFVKCKENSMGLGVIVKNQRVKKMLTQNDRFDMMAPIFSYIKTLDKKD